MSRSAAAPPEPPNREPVSVPAGAGGDDFRDDFSGAPAPWAARHPDPHLVLETRALETPALETPALETIVLETIVYLTRHGLSEHNLKTDVYMGRSPESRLVAAGREQARRLGARLAGGEFAGDGLAAEKMVQKIIASSLPRTEETAGLIGQALGLENVETEDAFWELSKGDWEGVMPRWELPEPIARALAEDPFGFRYPGGESYRDVTARAAPVFDAHVSANPGVPLLFVLHGDVLRALLHHTLGFPPEKIGDFIIDPCSLTELRWIEGRYHLARFNDGAHLG